VYEPVFQFVFASTVPTDPFTLAVEWQWLHRSVLVPSGAPAGAVSPSTASTDVVVTTFANSINPLMCFGRPAIDVLFVFDT